MSSTYTSKVYNSLDRFFVYVQHSFEVWLDLNVFSWCFFSLHCIFLIVEQLICFTFFLFIISAKLAKKLKKKKTNLQSYIVQRMLFFIRGEFHWSMKIIQLLNMDKSKNGLIFVFATMHRHTHTHWTQTLNLMWFIVFE